MKILELTIVIVILPILNCSVNFAVPFLLAERVSGFEQGATSSPCSYLLTMATMKRPRTFHPLAACLEYELQLGIGENEPYFLDGGAFTTDALNDGVVAQNDSSDLALAMLSDDVVIVLLREHQSPTIIRQSCCTLSVHRLPLNRAMIAGRYSPATTPVRAC